MNMNSTHFIYPPSFEKIAPKSKMHIVLQNVGLSNKWMLACYHKYLPETKPANSCMNNNHNCTVTFL